MGEWGRIYLLLQMGEDLDEFLGDARGAAGFSHALLTVAIDGGEAIGGLEKGLEGGGGLGGAVEVEDGAAEEAGLGFGEGGGKLGSLAAEGDCGFAESDELFGGGACHGDREVGTVGVVGEFGEAEGELVGGVGVMEGVGLCGGPVGLGEGGFKGFALEFWGEGGEEVKLAIVNLLDEVLYGEEEEVPVAVGFGGAGAGEEQDLEWVSLS